MKQALFFFLSAIWPLGALAQVPEYVGSQTCAECHADAYSAWEGSHHALAWTPAESDFILGDFNNTEFSHDGTVSRFRLEEGKPFVEVTEKDGVTTDYPIHSVAGVAPLQQYLLETEEGRLQSFDVVWDVEEERWYHLYPDQDLPPDDGLHWTGPYKNWNARCAECHATGFEKNYSSSDRSYASVQAEIGVGCEACHGPGSAHLDWAAGLEIAREPAGLDDYGFSMSFGQSGQSDMEQCAGCHSRREPFAQGNPLPGTPYDDAYGLAVLRPGLYHADGQILDEVYVWGSFLQSKMYDKGVTCGDCHDPHTAERIAEGNTLCAQCHSPAGNPDFPSLTLAAYDTPEHHFHEAGSEGAQCVNCHMIERVYMGVDWRRDHSFRIPRPDLSGETGAPNACTDCHRDETAAWAAQVLEEWYPDSVNRGPHYGQVLARGRTRPDLVRGDLIELASDQASADIVRATALFLLESVTEPEVAAQLAPLLSDDNALVRAHATRMQRGAEPQDRIARLFESLSDPAKSVRIAAARELLDIPPNQLPPRVRADLGPAMGEWQRTLAARIDFPETHLILGGMALTMRNPEAAENAFREVVELDPQRSEAWVMLVRIAAATEGRDAARQVLFEALRVLPGDPVLQDFASQL